MLKTWLNNRLLGEYKEEREALMEKLRLVRMKFRKV